jgi:hypothetical protein
MGACQRKRGGAVIERRSRPCNGVVTGGALLRQVCLHMIRVRRAGVICKMTRGTS